MSDSRIRSYSVHEVRENTLLVSPGDVDSIQLWAAPYPVDLAEFTSINIRGRSECARTA
ncbi:hypothetical protein ACFV1W_40340 [Kitasatospora sp. NPDC059648]|uniref:hypothetical protein n=1 Tax=Kitasatospora sp. NPDC059648 TaxID=3346894 RepID=UPI003674C386